jgi:hypothetical protein
MRIRVARNASKPGLVLWKEGVAAVSANLSQEQKFSALMRSAQLGDRNAYAQLLRALVAARGARHGRAHVARSRARRRRLAPAYVLAGGSAACQRLRARPRPSRSHSSSPLHNHPKDC